MFAVHPKRDCPHVETIDVDGVCGRFNNQVLEKPCQTCSDAAENWLCLQCEGIFCSRYVNGHMVAHNEDVDHVVALSFSDASVWCYACDSYIISPSVERLTRKLGGVKHCDINALAPIPEELDEVDLKSELPKISYEDIVEGMINKKYTNIVFMTGAGISVAAGIPDFRTPGTGLYAKVGAMGLPFPELIFSLDYLKQNPEPFFKVSKDFLDYKANPVKSHYFMKKVADEGMLLMSFTQNIDGLELEAGLSEELLVQAHGHMRTAHCCECGISVPISEFFAHVQLETVLYCVNCDNIGAGPRGIIKPDVIFFGESLPVSFFTKREKVKEADLVFVMGTSLQVFPFAALLDLVAPGVPVVLVNREDPGRVDTARNPVVFLQGDIEDSVIKLAEDLGWELNGCSSTNSSQGDGGGGGKRDSSEDVLPAGEEQDLEGTLSGEKA